METTKNNDIFKAPAGPILRNNGTFQFAANFEVLNKAPLDARQVVNTFAGLLLATTWQDSSSNIWLFDGLVVSVVADTTPALNGVYYLKDANDYTNPLSWEKLETISGGTYTFVQSGSTVIMQSGGTVTIFSPVAKTDLSGFTDNNNLLFNKAYSGLTGKPDLSVYQSVSGFTQFSGTTLPNNFYNKGEVDGLISGFTTGDTDVSSSWSGITGNPSGSTALMDLLTNYVDNVTYNYDNNILSQELDDITNGLTYLSGHTGSGSTGTTNSSWSGLTGNPTDNISLMSLLSGFSSGGTYNLSSPVAVSVGGFNIGDDLTGKTAFQLFEILLVPTLYPTFGNPSNSFGFSFGSYYEIGLVTDIDFNAYFDQGSINPAYNTSGLYSGLPTAYHYTNGLPSTVSSTDLYDSETITGYTVVAGMQSWSSNVDYSSGDTVINDSKGNYYADALVSGSTGDMSVSFEGVLPIFGTTSSISTQTKQTLVSQLYGNNIVLALVAESGGNKQSFEVAASWLTARPLTGIMTFNTVSNNYEYQGGSASASLTNWTTSSVTETIQGNTITYTKRTYNGSDRAAVTIKLVF